MMPVAERFRSIHKRVFGPSPRQRWDNGLASLIASKSYDSEMNPEHWNLEFVRAKQAIKEHHAEYGDRP